MPHKIFLSHNHNDKPLVEAVAIKLASIFGQDQVFYDSWSIKPGDGIIDQMNKGLEAPEFVFFFVSKNSLASGMVKLEWQNALYSASKGRTRIVPVRIDGSEMPAVLKQTLFIDMHTVGLDAAIAQIVSVTQGNASFTPQHLGFSNLSYAKSNGADGSVEITVKASHLMEPNPHFALVVGNPEEELQWEMVNGQPFMGGFNKDAFTLSSGGTAGCISFRPLGGALTPAHPLRFRVKPRGKAPVQFFGLHHQKGETEWVPVPVDTRGFVSIKIS
ncbi:TIR domain-containing protein [Sphingomonas changnyeongensis]|uniref:TIR domain-containing protein n=1 Tax=Sphingomonas changnyeongensis TaxID=2698679 RepID=A0A7Z2S8X6_9SPHN|nr:toll/interleukin-1 receptor domain-containing protein [Sphingomonas changnyeongensis]QHL91167.1 TIR domain-containing protein [Sphingomonas changnyeongensis]